jgi:hypothetical protein
VLADRSDVIKSFGSNMTRESFYVAQENILPLPPFHKKVIENNLISEYYTGYDPLSGEYIPKERFRFMFPNPSPSPHILHERKDQEREDEETQSVLLECYDAIRLSLLKSHEIAKVESYDTLRQKESLKRFVSLPAGGH